MEIKISLPRHSSSLAADRAAGVFAVLGSEVRLAILRHLVRAGPEGLTVGALQERLDLAASTLSHHLKAMSQAGVLVQRRSGRVLNCHADFALLGDLAAFLLSECCAEEQRVPAILNSEGNRVE